MYFSGANRAEKVHLDFHNHEISKIFCTVSPFVSSLLDIPEIEILCFYGSMAVIAKVRLIRAVGFTAANTVSIIRIGGN